jgi:hypothetical protein
MALGMMNGTRPYKSAHGHDIGHDMSCYYVIKHESFGNQTTEQAGSMFYLVRQQYHSCPVCNHSDIKSVYGIDISGFISMFAIKFLERRERRERNMEMKSIVSCIEDLRMKLDRHRKDGLNEYPT